MNESEEKPLLQTKERQKNAAINLGMPRWLALSLSILVTALHMSSVVLTMYVMNQYSYQAYMKEKYPTSSHKSTGGQSACELNTSTTEYKEQVVIQKLTSELNIYCSLATYNVIGVIFTLNLATYSDVYGRKLFFIAPFIGTLLKTLLCTITIYFNLKLEWIILFFCIEGCTGTWVSTLSMAYSFMADLTQPGKPRTFVIGCFETCLGLAAFITTMLSGYLIKWTDGFFYPALISTAMVLTGLVVVIFILPETLHDSKKRSEVSFIQNMGRVTDVYRKGFSPDGKQWMFIILLFIFMMSNLANIARPQIETLYQLNSPFCWSSVKIGWYGSMRLGLSNVGNLAMIYLFHLCTTDEYIVLASMLTSLVSLTIEGLATNDFMLYLDGRPDQIRIRLITMSQTENKTEGQKSNQIRIRLIPMSRLKTDGRPDQIRIRLITMSRLKIDGRPDQIRIRLITMSRLKTDGRPDQIRIRIRLIKKQMSRSNTNKTKQTEGQIKYE
ncbi:SLC46A3 [Mytilus coruscus]|uniref:SLC46A3 n=1 Tax=Mytilus coruscus TaxID=42192 RepID=A0A6J8AQZ5_MYTCO|nr:SLC46A3 [Mytilus coruscus]